MYETGVKKMKRWLIDSERWDMVKEKDGSLELLYMIK